MCNTFIKIGILPEIIGKYYSKEPVVNSLSSPDQEIIDPTEVDEDKLLWCYCRRPEEGREIIACDNTKST